MKTFKDFRNLLESHLEETYDIYHDHYNAAVNHAAEHVHKKTGLHVHDRDLMNIPRKPVPGQTNRLRFQLHKDGQPTNKYAHVQVYHHDSKKEKPFELNTYHDTGKHKIEEGNAENKAEYNQQSVDKAIANSRQKIGKKESKAIHRLLKGRRSNPESDNIGVGKKLPSYNSGWESYYSRKNKQNEEVEQIDERNIENRNKKDAAARKLSANGYDVAAGRAIQKGSKFITKTRDSLATTNKMKTARAEKDRKVFVKAVRDRKNKAPEQGASSWYKQGRYSGD